MRDELKMHLMTSGSAFDDQCIKSNPRYPLMSEIKAMYLRAYYGKEVNPEDIKISNINNQYK